MQTKCLNCGRVLTNSEGVRLESAIADSKLPHMPMEDDVTWLRCGECHKVTNRATRSPKKILGNRSSIKTSNEELLRETAAMIKYILTDGYKYEGGQEILDKIEAIVGKEKT